MICDLITKEAASSAHSITVSGRRILSMIHCKLQAWINLLSSLKFIAQEISILGDIVWYDGISIPTDISIFHHHLGKATNFLVRVELSDFIH
jgi:hypothetical protein